MAELLRQAANGDPDRVAYSQFILEHVAKDWDWFLATGHPQAAWGLEVLRALVKPDHAGIHRCLTDTVA